MICGITPTHLWIFDKKRFKFLKDYHYIYFNAAAGVIFDPNEEHIVGQVGLIQYSKTHPLIIVGQVSGLTPGKRVWYII